MRGLAILAISLWLAACATPQPSPGPDNLFKDRVFPAPSVRIDPADVFAVSEEMKRYVRTVVAREAVDKGRREALFEALYKKSDLKLEYDSAMTRNASEAFAAHSGNCLSLVIMTAALAKEMGLPVRFQSAYLEDTWSRSGDVQFFIGHVNLSLGRRTAGEGSVIRTPDLMTIDFLPPAEIRALRTREIAETTIVAMYMNNKAAEALAHGDVGNGYWWARAAIKQDPEYLSSYNTIGVIYRRHGDLAAADKVLTWALERQPDNARVMSNLVLVLEGEGRVAEAESLKRKLEKIDPDPPFAFFNRGLKAMQNRDFNAARDLFAKEVDRAPNYAEFHFWLAAAYIGLSEFERARKELSLAIEYSTTRDEHDLYAAKLARIGSQRLQ